MNQNLSKLAAMFFVALLSISSATAHIVNGVDDNCGMNHMARLDSPTAQAARITLGITHGPTFPPNPWDGKVHVGMGLRHRGNYFLVNPVYGKIAGYQRPLEELNPMVLAAIFPVTLPKLNKKFGHGPTFPPNPNCDDYGCDCGAGKCGWIGNGGCTPTCPGQLFKQ